MYQFNKNLLLLCIVASLQACSGSEKSEFTVTTQMHDHGDGNLHSHGNENENLVDWLARFEPDSIIGTPFIVDCKLSGGTETSCVSITLQPAPANMTIGPWCPRNINDGPEKSGIWLESGKVYDADGDFIKKLATFYKDDKWEMFDSITGAINVTDSKVSCQAAARPDVDPKYQNYCVECQVSHMEEGASMTYVIPISAVKASKPSQRVGFSGVGLAFSGARLDASAPTHAILAAHTLAPFDDCGGHVNLHAGYHIHAVTGDCLKAVPVEQNHAAAIGIAMDGFPLHNRLNFDGSEAADLDVCGGHEFGELGYHYHVSEPGKNAIIACHVGEVGCALDNDSAVCDASVRPPRPPR